MAESYTPGHSQNAVDFMSRRTLESHGQFFLPYLEPGLSVLDCGCGPGTMTLDIGARVAPAKVVGVDFSAAQMERASAGAKAAAISNVHFQTADCYSLPFEGDAFHRIFSHALMEHLSEPVRALVEFRRVLKPGGIVGICSPDFQGLLIAPSSPELARAVGAYEALQARNGGDLRIGHKLGSYLRQAGFAEVRMSARYECYPTLPLIGEYLALRLERENDPLSAAALRAWSRREEGGMFAQAWVSALARRA